MKWIIGVLLVGILVTALGFTPLYLRRQHVTVRGHDIAVECAVTNYQRTRGLMYRDALPDGAGMLLTYATDGVRAIWMHNMRFAIDAVWINAANQVVDMAYGMRPELDTHTGSALAKYVLEVPAGTIATYGIIIGDTVTWR